MFSRLALALLISGFIPVNSFGRWEAQSAPTPRSSRILATRLVRAEGNVEAHRETPRVLSCFTLVLLAMGGGFVWLGLCKILTFLVWVGRLLLVVCGDVYDISEFGCSVGSSQGQCLHCSIQGGPFALRCDVFYPLGSTVSLR